ncbi:SpaH/EbpB family LPXTG-anchored major pilin [Corynebacterium nasicanis]|uniref:SpaH/EbpB family LPXTG-anchored major pilin n=1 Tax=Corynebacterium nasicanis TaxID=1448267 RepID=A0ABW1QEF2_9CORY
MASVSFKRTAAFVAAFGIALAPATAGLAIATAQTNPAPAYNSIDWTQNGQASLTVVKKLLGAGENPGDPATGETIGTTPGTLLEGVTFQLQQVTNVDLSTNEGWAAASKIANGAADAVTPVLDEGITQTTGANGEAVFSGLQFGLYLVTETVVPEGVVPSAPFYVFVPMTSLASDGTPTTAWNYNPVVYPKNTSSTATKEVVDADDNVGDSITYTIKSDIPAVATNATTITKYIVQDDLDEEQLTTTPGQITVGLSDGTVFAQGTDYTVTVNAATQQVEIVFTAAGLQKLTDAKTANSAVQVVTTIEADVKEIGGTDGIVKNQAIVITNNGSGGGDTTTTTNEVETKWGKVTINKKNEAGETLAGAEFQLYRCEPGADGGSVLIGGPLTVGTGVTEPNTFVTNAQGTFTIDGLHVTNLENHDDAINKFYCLVETKAPAGYAKLVEPIRFQLHPGAPGVTDVTGANIVYTADVLNVDDDDFLPETGGMGVGLIIAAGAGIIGAGAYAARRNSAKS